MQPWPAPACQATMPSAVCCGPAQRACMLRSAATCACMRRLLDAALVSLHIKADGAIVASAEHHFMPYICRALQAGLATLACQAPELFAACCDYYNVCMHAQVAGCSPGQPRVPDTLPKCAAHAGPRRGHVLQPGQQHLGHELHHVAAVQRRGSHHALQVRDQLNAAEQPWTWTTEHPGVWSAWRCGSIIAM